MFGKKKQSKYLDVRREFRKQQRHNLAHKIPGLNQWEMRKHRKEIEANNIPDVSTVTDRIAFVIDGMVQEIIFCQPKMTNVLLNKPRIVLIPKDQDVKLGFLFKKGKFIDPSRIDNNETS